MAPMQIGEFSRNTEMKRQNPYFDARPCPPYRRECRLITVATQMTDKYLSLFIIAKVLIDDTEFGL